MLCYSVKVYKIHGYSDIFEIARDGKDESEKMFLIFR